MSELEESVPMPARVTNQGRCAEGPSIKTMLGDWCVTRIHTSIGQTGTPYLAVQGPRRRTDSR